MSYLPILNPDLFWGGEVRLTADVHDPETLEVRWHEGKRLSWADVLDMLAIGITDIPVHHNGMSK
jgi:hypothetical protein